MTDRLTTAMQQSTVPLAVMMDRSLSVFECVVEYLKDAKGLSYRQIAMLTNRNDRTIWTVYNRAKKKRELAGIPAGGWPESWSRAPTSKTVMLPVGIFHDRTAAVLETIALYLKDVAGFSYREIAELTNRNERTIWTAYNRARRKCDSRNLG